MFWQENLRAYPNEIFEKLSVHIEKFRTIKCAGSQLLLFCEGNYGKVEKMTV